MKIYIPEKLFLIRLTIKGNCQDTQYLNLINTNHSEVVEFIIKSFASNMVKSSKFSTTIDIRRCEGGVNFNSQRVKLYGIKPNEVKEKIENLLKPKP